MSPRLKIAFCGAHSTGKSTLSAILGREFGLPVFSSITRHTPKELRGTPAGQMRILFDYIGFFSKFAHEDWLCDRSIFDVCVYSHINGVWGTSLCNAILEEYARGEISPTHIFYLPIEFPLVDDGQRPDNKSREEFDVCARDFLDRFWPGYDTISGSVEQRVAQVKNSLRGYCHPSLPLSQLCLSPEPTSQLLNHLQVSLAPTHTWSTNESKTAPNQNWGQTMSRLLNQ